MEERRPSLKCINCLNGYAVSDRPDWSMNLCSYKDMVRKEQTGNVAVIVGESLWTRRVRQCQESSPANLTGFIGNDIGLAGQDIERESIEFFDKGYRKREAISWQK